MERPSVFGLVIYFLGLAGCGSPADAPPSVEPPVPQTALPTPSDQAQETLDKALRLAALGQTEQAIRMIESVLADTPEHPAALSALGQLHLAGAIPIANADGISRGLRALKAAAQLAPGDMQAARLYAFSLLRAGDEVAAADALSVCSMSDPGGCGAFLFELGIMHPSPERTTALKRLVAGTMSCQADSAIQIPGWPATGHSGIYIAVPNQPSDLPDEGALEPFEIVNVSSIAGTLATYRDQRRTDNVRKTGWTSNCTASSNRSPPCTCTRGGSKIGTWGVQTGPNSKKVLFGAKEAAERRALYTGRDRVISIGLGVNVRWCELAWFEKEHIDKRASVSRLRPTSLPLAEAQLRVSRLKTAFESAPDAVANALDGVWCKQLPFVLVADELGLNAARPSEFRVRDGAILETYRANRLDLTVVVHNGRIHAIESLTPNVSSASNEMPPTGAGAGPVAQPGGAAVAPSESLEDLTSLATAESSSALPPWKTFTFAAKNLIDGQLATSWQPSAKQTHGVGEWFTLRFAHPVEIHELRVANGYQFVFNGSDLFPRNARMRDIELELGTHKFSRSLSGSDRGFAPLVIDPPVLTEFVRVKILAIHAGSEWPDLAVSEVQVFGRPVAP